MRARESDPADIEFWEDACLHAGWTGLPERRSPGASVLPQTAFAFPTGWTPDRAATAPLA